MASSQSLREGERCCATWEKDGGAHLEAGGLAAEGLADRHEAVPHNHHLVQLDGLRVATKTMDNGVSESKAWGSRTPGERPCPLCTSRADPGRPGPLSP